MKSIPYLLLRIVEDTVKGESVTRHLLRLNKWYAKDPEILRSYQFVALKRLLNHAYLNIPFYKRRFEALGMHPGDVKSFEDFAAFPTLSREDIRNHGKEIISKKVKKNQLSKGVSSGSTGESITFFYDKKSHSAGKAAVLSGWMMAGKKPGDKFATVWGNQTTVEEEWARWGSRIKARLHRNLRIGAYQLVSDNKVKEAVDLIRKQKGGYVQGYTNAVYTIALYVYRNGIAFEPRLDGVLTTAETLFPYQRKIIEEVMGPVYDGYGSQEIQGIAFQCRERNGYHIVEPNVVFETMDFCGETKEIVVTDLWNYAWPLIRYRIGDLTSGATARCSCGCAWRTIAGVEGRTSDVISTPGGGFIDLVAWRSEDFDKFAPFIDRFQLAKVAHDKLVLRVQIKDAHAGILSEIESSLAPHFKNIMKFEVERVDSFRLSKSGKHKMIVDETLDDA